MRGRKSGASEQLIVAAERLKQATLPLRFARPVTHVYHPLDYAWPIHESYLRTYGAGRKRVVFLGMNPGPFGMVQTGVPFGEIRAVRDWLRLRGDVGRPAVEHPKRRVEGLNCRRCEISGQRLWGLFQERYVDPERFFAEHFVANFCPVAFVEESGRNRTPDKLPAGEVQALYEACDAHFAALLDCLQPEWVVGVGQFAARRAERLVERREIRTCSILHPSPASPLANRDWAGTVTRALVEAGIW